MKTKDITDAWAWIRKNNQSIPDEVLDFMKDAAIAQLHSLSEPPTPTEDKPLQDELWDELSNDFRVLSRMEENDWGWNREILKSKFKITKR